MLTTIAALIGALLYRLRGGLLKTLFVDLANVTTWRLVRRIAIRLSTSTHLCRAIWSVPTAALIYWLVDGSSPWLLVSLVASVWVSMSAYGHGAHMIMDAETFARSKGSKTEMLTGFWLPKLFGGVPDETWLETRPQDINLYSIVGMSAIGLVRNSTAVLPLLLFEPSTAPAAAAYAASGLSHGLLYWIGQKIDDGRMSEIVVGGATWATLVAILR